MTNEIEKKENVERIEAGRVYVPHVDIFETDDNIVILADMPDVDENSVDITLEKNVLSISGYTEPNRPDNYSLAYAEYEAGSYRRNFTLSDMIDRDNIGATVKDGVLSLTLPKAAPALAKKIAIKVG